MKNTWLTIALFRGVFSFKRAAPVLFACLCGSALLPVAMAGQFPESTPDAKKQQAPPVGLPARAPGYELYYRNEDQNIAFATRWGYYDGWRDGKHDAELSLSKPPIEQDRYKLVPDHGLHPGIPRTTYKSVYRTAYLHGYDYGAKQVNGVKTQAPR
jgi:hypothetical protein